MNKMFLILFKKDTQRFEKMIVEIIQDTPLTYLVENDYYRVLKKEEENQITENLFVYKYFSKEMNNEIESRVKSAMLDLAEQIIKIKSDRLELLRNEIKNS